MSIEVFEKKAEDLASRRSSLISESAALAEELKDAVIDRLTVILSNLTKEERASILTEMHSSGYDVGTYVAHNIFLSDAELGALRELMYKAEVGPLRLIQLMKNQRLIVSSPDGTSETFLIHMSGNNSIMLGRET